jgi:branched-chain amino acid transport system substrate-binding protein
MKKVLYIAGLIVALGLLAGCNSQKSIVIGGLFPLSGNAATYGQSSKQGIELAIEEVNKAGGIMIDGKPQQVQTAWEDDEGLPEKAANACQKLISQNNICALLGAVISKNSLAVAPICQESNIPMITPTSTNEKVTEAGDCVFRACFIDPFQGTIMANYAYNVLGMRRAAVIYDNANDYNKGLAGVFSKRFAELGGTIVASEAFTDEATTVDFKAQLTNIKAAKPDFLYSPNYYAADAIIMKQSHELGLNVATGGSDGWDSPKLLEIGGSDVNGCVFTNHFSKDDSSAVVQRFVKNYRARFNADPDALASLSYDAAVILLNAIKTAGSTNPDAIKQALRNTSVTGVSGTIKFDSKRNPVKSAVILKIENNRQVFVTRVNP